MNEKYTAKTESLRQQSARHTRSGGARWGMDDDSGMRHVPFPVGTAADKSGRKDKALDFIRDSMLIILGIFIVFKILSFTGELIGRFVDWAASFLF